MIVTPEGLNVFPEDVERVLNTSPGVRDSAVVGVRGRRRERVHAVLVVDPGVDAGRVVRGANARARRSPEDPARARLAGARAAADRGHAKLKRAAIREWANGRRRRAPARQRAATS